MQSSVVSGGYGNSALQDLLRLMQANLASGAGQNVQGASSAPSASSAAADATSPQSQTQTQSPTPIAGPAGQFATLTLASLLNYQQPSSWASNTASQLIGQLDSNGDGQLSLGEVEKALGATTSAQQSGLSQAFAQVDTDGDGQISQSELAAAITNRQQDQGEGATPGVHRHHHHDEAATATQMAQDMINALDQSGGGSLSLAALESDLGLTGASGSAPASAGASSSSSGAAAASTSSISTTGSSSPLATSLSQAFGSLDTNGDGQISVSELASAIQAFRQAQEASWANPWTNGLAGASAAV